MCLNLMESGVRLIIWERDVGNCLICLLNLSELKAADCEGMRGKIDSISYI